jgi:hypothetical protein
MIPHITGNRKEGSVLPVQQKTEQIAYSMDERHLDHEPKDMPAKDLKSS